MALTVRRRQVAAVGAEVDRRPERGVVDVLYVAPPVVVPVDRHGRPCRRQELHGADGPVEAPAAVEAPGVGVRDARGAVPAVEQGSEDRRVGDTVRVEVASAHLAVVGLDLTDRGQERPVEPAVRVCGADHHRRTLVGRQSHTGDPGGGRVGARLRCGQRCGLVHRPPARVGQDDRRRGLRRLRRLGTGRRGREDLAGRLLAAADQRVGEQGEEARAQAGPDESLKLNASAGPIPRSFLSPVHRVYDGNRTSPRCLPRFWSRPGDDRMNTCSRPPPPGTRPENPEVPDSAPLTARAS